MRSTWTAWGPHGAGSPRRGGQRVGMAGLARDGADDPPDRVVVVEGVRILPAFAERVGERGDRGPVHLELGVVPRGTRAEARVELDRLRVAAVAGVVVAAVAEVDPADERDVVVG